MDQRVFFISRSPRFDYSSASEFGKPVFLMEDRELSPFNVDGVMDRIDERMEEEGFRIETDFVAITGPSALVALFMCYLGGLAMKADTPLRTLLFSAPSSKYQLRVLTLPRALVDL